MKKIMRPHQVKAVGAVKDAFSRDKSMLVVIPAGGGKTLVTAEIAEMEIDRTQKVILVTRQRKLVSQLSEEMTEAGLDHGVYMAGAEKFNPFHPVQVASIDTLRARMNYPHIDSPNVTIIIDEAHFSKSPSFQNFLKMYPTANIVGLTATPYNGLSHFDEYCRPITANELVEQGHLVPLNYYAQKIINTEGIKLVAGEFHQEQLSEKNYKNRIIGEIVDNWLKFADHRPTLLFAINIKHSKRIAKEFNDRGIAARHIDADSTDEERAQAEKDLINGIIKVVSNCGLWCTGVNIPLISCIQDCAPCMSYNLYVQKHGRGSRTNEIYSNCTIIDNAGNVNRHGHAYDERDVDLSSTTDKKTDKGPVEKMQTCPNCFRAFTPGPPSCPHCGSTREIKSPRISEVTGELSYLTDADFRKIEEKRRFTLRAEMENKFQGKYNQRIFQMRTFKGLKEKSADQKLMWLWEKMISDYGESYCLTQRKITFPKAIQQRIKDKNAPRSLASLGFL